MSAHHCFARTDTQLQTCSGARLEATAPWKARAEESGAARGAGLSPAGGAPGTSAAAPGGDAAVALGDELFETLEFSLRVPSGLEQVFAPPPNRANLGARHACWHGAWQEVCRAASSMAVQPRAMLCAVAAFWLAI